MSHALSDAPASSGALASVMTLEQFILDRRDRFPQSTRAFARLLRDVSVAAKIINHNIRRAGILDVMGETGTVNVQDEKQKKLDEIADRELERALRRGGECCLIGSEEQPETVSLSPHGNFQERFAVFFDPLDGSSNTDVNASVGTIFSVYTLPEDIDEEDSLDVTLRPGADQVAAGYVAYGSSTMFVFTTGNGVNGFTLDPGIGEFLLTHPDLQIPQERAMYSINEADIEDFSPKLRAFLQWLKTKDPDTGARIRARYIGSFVSDFHRNLLTGGLYMYPARTNYPNGKLRLMYEANPMAFLVEQAGGRASTGHQRVLDLQPEGVHQRTPLFIGSAPLVEAAEAYLQDREEEVPRVA
ncbi:class 1 fructose-bisphosphatase [Salinibacter altiplanensis]|uniref:class 1 fructose-bisphosphatase n=1 Tax=Salinibacter altiplanensis TaxID=1803181 RepID=UPI000C9F4D60|nr:class 1 fructose-bisphosphatase [Salinibacter altiplanensis]